MAFKAYKIVFAVLVVLATMRRTSLAQPSGYSFVSDSVATQWLRSGALTSVGFDNMDPPGTRGDALLFTTACENDYLTGLVGAILAARNTGWKHDVVVLATGLTNLSVAAIFEAGATDVVLYPRTMYVLGGWQPANFSDLVRGVSGVSGVICWYTKLTHPVTLLAGLHVACILQTLRRTA